MNMGIIWGEGIFVTRGQEQSELCMPFFSAGRRESVLLVKIPIFPSSNRL
jgi:hypothetical protein